MENVSAGKLPDAATGRKRPGLFGKLGGQQAEPAPLAAAQTVATEPKTEVEDSPEMQEDFALKSPSNAAARMVVPSDVEIEGTLRSRSETDIAGRVDGEVTVEAALRLSKGAVVTGAVKATNFYLDGEVSGTVECADDFELGSNGVLTSDAMAGNNVTIAGRMEGSVRCGGRLVLKTGAHVTGDIRTRTLIVEDGATFEGACSMSSKKK